MTPRRIQISTHQLRRVRDRFAEMLRAPTQERDWQLFFAAHPYVLSRSLPLRLEASDIHPLGRPGLSEPDFIFYSSDTNSAMAYGIIELKRPDTQILTLPRRQVASLSANARTAERQARVYAKQLNRQLVPHGTEMLGIGNRLHLFLILGVSTELVEKLKTEQLKEQERELLPEDVTLMPYDQLYEAFAAEVPPEVRLLAPLHPVAADVSPVLVDYFRGGQARFRRSVHRSELHGIVGERHNRISTLGACPYCGAVAGAVKLGPHRETVAGRMIPFFTGQEGTTGYRMLACTRASFGRPLEFCEVYNLAQAAEWFRDLQNGLCGRCGSDEIDATELDNFPTSITKWVCSKCGLAEEKHAWAAMSAGA